MDNNIVTAVFGAFKETRTRKLWQWDYGMKLRFVGLDLPPSYTVHQANEPMSGSAKTRLGDETGVDILDEYLTTGKNVYVWLYLHSGDSDGETVYMVTIPVQQRPRPTEDEPTPVQQGLIEQALAALNAGVAEAEAAAELLSHPGAEASTLEPGSAATAGYADGVFSFGIPQGEQGVPGQDGQDGQDGADGVSPTVTVTDITGGHRVSITDAEGTQTFDVMDGETPTVPVEDVQVNGTSVVSGGVAQISLPKTETVTGLTPSIQGVADTRYVCGEVATLAITVPATGIIDVVFTSGSTPTVLTITPPSGVTAVKWANGFDPTSLDADTTYEINIADGEFGVSAAWT